MAGNAIRAKLDIIFKKLFSDNIDLLHDLLSSLLEIPKDSIKSVKIQNSEILPDDIAGKFIRMDLKMRVDDKLVNVEMQIKDEPDYKDRTLFYWSKMYSGDLKSGEEYGELKHSVSINIINFNMFDCKEYHSSFAIMEKTRHEILSDKCAIHFFELKKIGKQANKENRMELWLQLINAETEEEFDMLEQTGIPPIQKAVYVLHQMSEDEKLQESARLREKALHVEASALGHARREGIEIGEKRGEKRGRADGMKIGEKKGVKIGEMKGRQDEKIKTAINLLAMGLSAEQISQATGLDIEEIKKIK